ncbi:YlbE-like family protein [Virgibacillus soli]|uniref:YlbE-like family protein n=1 Tax=Paracerasibacillus soli TaxID=480284 RepID=UPI0035E7D93C
MDKNVIIYLKSRPDLLQFVRKNPMWYRYLSRNPENIYKMEREAKVFYGKTFSQRLDTLQDQIQLTSMLMQLAEAMKD